MLCYNLACIYYAIYKINNSDMCFIANRAYKIAF